MATVTTFDAYLGRLKDTEQRAYFEGLIDWVRQSFPVLNLEMKWNQPHFTNHGTFICGFSAMKSHIGFAAEQTTLDHFDELVRVAGFTRTRMLMRIPWGTPLPIQVVEQMIEFNIADKKTTTTYWRHS